MYMNDVSVERNQPSKNEMDKDTQEQAAFCVLKCMMDAFSSNFQRGMFRQGINRMNLLLTLLLELQFERQ